MATTAVGFRWLDILEKEFDKACVELDTSLMEMEAEEPEVVFTARQKIATLGSCFAQLTHKALTIFQNSAKIESILSQLVTGVVTTGIITIFNKLPPSALNRNEELMSNHRKLKWRDSGRVCLAMGTPGLGDRHYASGYDVNAPVSALDCTDIGYERTPIIRYTFSGS
ncbi:Golgi-associated PDZ and coiled-coil motif-containing protein [Eumeta japonica]|uniref:Golgi-associated PDZ and coiled-coil motif-containing protein n=1 Tax=Eumeta variegata TaxID=151549 RepID=A0A4C1V3E1_EUMVA|nr:Golgi-associated PDZ and coiled-coil motif-containing protein [Eumeta japonica]